MLSQSASGGRGERRVTHLDALEGLVEKFSFDIGVHMMSIFIGDYYLMNTLRGIYPTRLVRPIIQYTERYGAPLFAEG